MYLMIVHMFFDIIGRYKQMEIILTFVLFNIINHGQQSVCSKPQTWQLMVHLCCYQDK